MVDIALSLVDDQGPEALTLAAVASRAGVATPSLYKHVAGLGQLRSLVAARVIAEMAEAATGAVLGHSGDAAVTALMRVLRDYAVQHPARYACVPADSLHDPALADASGKFLGVFLAVLRHYDLDGPAAVHATRSLRVIVYGFAAIETTGGFGLAEDPGETFAQMIEMYLSYLHRTRS